MTTTFVCTATVANAHNVTPREGIALVELTVNPAKCKTPLGRWLAENIKTTVFNDDLSTLTLTAGETNAHGALRQEVERLLTLHRCEDDTDHDVLTSKLRELAEHQRKVAKMSGELHFRRMSMEFSWPVLGSNAAHHIAEPAAYFDHCAGMIRKLKPISAQLWNGQEVPKELI